MSFVIEIEHYRRTSDNGVVLTDTTRSPHVHTSQAVAHLMSIMQERNDRFSGMEDWELSTCRDWLTNALDRAEEIGDLHIGGREWEVVSIWTKL